MSAGVVHPHPSTFAFCFLFQKQTHLATQWLCPELSRLPPGGVRPGQPLCTVGEGESSICGRRELGHPCCSPPALVGWVVAASLAAILGNVCSWETECKGRTVLSSSQGLATLWGKMPVKPAPPRMWVPCARRLTCGGDEPRQAGRSAGRAELRSLPAWLELSRQQVGRPGPGTSWFSRLRNSLKTEGKARG